MKRMIIAGILLIFTVILMVFSKANIIKYCNSTEKELKKVIDCVENKDFKKAKEYANNIKTPNKLLPYLYKDDIREIRHSYDMMFVGIEEKDKKETYLNAYEMLFDIKNIKDSQHLEIYSFF